jgi:predicted pyridoxine 5'-phosphate oxidase superfamily flavin-nucleotide-binding protein
MGRKFDALSEQHIRFIAKQKIFFVATAIEDSRVNRSPKGMDALRVVDAGRVLWLNLTPAAATRPLPTCSGIPG